MSSFVCEDDQEELQDGCGAVEYENLEQGWKVRCSNITLSASCQSLLEEKAHSYIAR